jgi:5'-nucleotidase
VRFVLTNDDGIDAPGLAALRLAVAGLGEALVVAPEHEWSGCGHQVTTGRPFRIEARGSDRVVHGTPADCVRVACARLAPQLDWVLSGINPGGNLGADIWHSGTVAAVREAALHGRPGIAFSHYLRRGLAVDWPRAAAWVAELLPGLLAAPPAPGHYLSVNLPHLEPGAARPDAVRCPLDTSPLPLRFRADGDAVCYDGDYHQRQRRPGHDVDICFGGRISVVDLAL